MQRKSRRTGQLLLPLNTWGGARKGAGRRRASGRSNTPHRMRPKHNPAHPLHITLRACLRPLRSQHVFPTLRRALARAAASPESFRIIQFSVQEDHLHLIVEASDKRALSSAMRGLVIRIARQVNRLLMRKGRCGRTAGTPVRSPRYARFVTR
jgi:putative transposase